MLTPLEDVRLTRAAEVLRDPPVALEADPDLVAALLESIAPLSPWWQEPYAAPWVPVIQAAVRLAERVLEVDRGLGGG